MPKISSSYFLKSIGGTDSYSGILSCSYYRPLSYYLVSLLTFSSNACKASQSLILSKPTTPEKAS